MATVGGSRALMIAQRGMRRDLKRLLQNTARRAGAAAGRYAGADGRIPENQADEAARDAGDVIQRTFTRADGRSSIDALGNPLSEYAKLVLYWGGWAADQVVKAHSRVMKKYAPDDVTRWLEFGRGVIREQEEPTLEELMARYADLRIFHPNPLALDAFDPNRQWVRPDRWVDQRGYRLSDRIWEASVRTRMKIDGFVRNAIRDGRGALELSRQLESFLAPERRTIRTWRPYGTHGIDASYDAMRLARTEIARVHAQAQWISSYLNPYVSKMEWHLSGSHPELDICDDMAGGSPYSLETCPLPVVASHPQCVTPGQIIQTRRGAIPIEQVRVGDEVLTHKGRYRKVLAAWNRPHRGIVYRINTGVGDFELTSEHPVMTSSGWINAKLIQSGKQILYAGINILLNSNLPVTEGLPTQIEQPTISPSVFHGIVPATSIALNSDLIFDDSEIEPVAQNGILHRDRDAEALQRQRHLRFERRWTCIFMPTFATAKCAAFRPVNRQPKCFPAVQTHLGKLRTGSTSAHLLNGFRIVHRIMQRFILRDFAPRFRAFRRVFVARYIAADIEHFLRPFSVFGSPSAIVVCPTCLDTSPDATHFDAVFSKQHAQHPKSDVQLFTDRRCTEPLDTIKIMQKLINLPASLGLDTKCVPIYKRQTMRMFCAGAFERFVANGANQTKIHDNLLSLSPDDEWGAASGCAVVSGVANPTQAHDYFSSVSQIEQRYYDGLVYNMEVEEDNSYTVNGAIVHNCLCYLSPVVADSPATVTRRLHDAMEESRRVNLLPYMTPIAAYTFTQLLLGNAINQVLRQLNPFQVGLL